MGLQPVEHTICCGSDRCRTHPGAVFHSSAVSRRTGPSSGRGGGGVCCGLWWHCRGGDGNRHGAEYARAGSEGIGAGRTIAADSASGGGTQTGDCQEPALAKAGDPTLVADLEALVEPTTRGDPQSPLRWTCKSVRRLAEALQVQGHQVSRTLVAELLNAAGNSLQANRKTKEGDSHPDRDAQFARIKHPSGRRI